MGKAIKNIFKTDELILTECTNGFYLWDSILGFNIAIHAKNEQTALIYGLNYYQKRFAKLEKEHKELREKVDSFICKFNTEEE